MSRIDGDYRVTIGGKEYTMCFNWKALSEVETEHGDTPNLFNSEVVASVASFGLLRHHPEMTKEKILELSPPLVPFINSVQKALNWAYFGKDNTPQDTEKKNILQVLGCGLSMLLKRLFRGG